MSSNINEFLVTDGSKNETVYVYLPKEYTLFFYKDVTYNIDGIKYIFQSAEPSYDDLDHFCNEDYYSYKFMEYISEITPLYELAKKHKFECHLSKTNISELIHFLEIKLLDFLIYDKTFHQKIIELYKTSLDLVLYEEERRKIYFKSKSEDLSDEEFQDIKDEMSCYNFDDELRKEIIFKMIKDEYNFIRTNDREKYLNIIEVVLNRIFKDYKQNVSKMSEEIFPKSLSE